MSKNNTSEHRKWVRQKQGTIKKKFGLTMKGPIKHTTAEPRKVRQFEVTYPTNY